MRELIETELEKSKDCFTQQDEGLDDESYFRLEKIIFEELEEEGFVTTFHHILKLANKIALEVFWQKDSWCERTSDFIVEHLSETIEFIKNECTADEFSTIAISLAEDITEKTKSKEFVDSIEEASKKFPKESETYYIFDDIKNCRIILE